MGSQQVVLRILSHWLSATEYWAIVRRLRRWSSRLLVRGCVSTRRLTCA